MPAVPLLQGKGLIKGKDLVYGSPKGLKTPEKRQRMIRGFSFTSTIPSVPMVEAPRTACPQNGSAFSYDPAYLAAWCMSEDLWARLPTRMTDSIAAVQHAGAAVFTGFKRLESLSESLPATEGLEADLVAVPSGTKPRGLSTASVSSHESGGASKSSSVASSTVSTPLSTPSLPSMPVSPFSLSPFTLDHPISKHHRPQLERSYSTPMDPHSEYYARELSHLRTDSLPCLRHAIRVVDREVNESKRLAELDADTLEAFEKWWMKKKAVAIGLNQKGQALSIQRGIPTNGLGWCA